MQTHQLALVVALCAAAALARQGPTWEKLTADYSFDDYCRDFGKRYASIPDKVDRKQYFDRNLKEILAHNADPSRSYNMGVNRFTDWSPEQRVRLNGGKRVDPEGMASITKPRYIHRAPVAQAGFVPPFEVDYRTWTNPRVLTSPKDQGYCGDCWSHSATESMESYFALLTGELHVFSQQQTTSCVNYTGCWTWKGKPAGGGGCGGGLTELAFDHVQNVGGVYAEWQYPFTDFFIGSEDPNASTANTSKCRNMTHVTHGLWTPQATTTGYVSVESNSANATMHALATKGPLSIYVAALLWYGYEGGIYENVPSNRSDSWKNFQIDHVVQLVGYGTDQASSTDYWIVRNSWGAEWGESGYIRLKRMPGHEPCGQNTDMLTCGNETSYNGTSACGTSALLLQPLYPLMKKVKNADF